MSENGSDDLEKEKESFLSWAFDKGVLITVGTVGVLLVGSVTYMTVDDGRTPWEATKMALGFSAFFFGGMFLVAVFFSTVELVFKSVGRSYANGGAIGVVFRPIAKALSLLLAMVAAIFLGLGKLIAGLIGLGIVLAILGGVAGLLLFGLRQLF